MTVCGSTLAKEIGYRGEFAGRVALVTGGSRGIGRACCRRLAAGGARIALNYVGDQAAAERTREEIRAAGGICDLFKADVSDEAAMEAAVKKVRETMGPITLLVANAGTTRVRNHADLGVAEWRETMRVNLDGTFISVRAVKDAMLEAGGGAMVCLSSIAALRPRAQQIDYAAAKAGVIAMVRCFAEALAPTVRVNAVAPGLTETDMIKEMDPAIFPGRIAATPLGRLAKPEEAAETVTFLLSDRARFTTGQTLVVSGGDVMLP